MIILRKRNEECWVEVKTKEEIEAGVYSVNLNEANAESVVELLYEGKTLREIARKRGIRHQAIHKALNRVLEKTGWIIAYTH